MAMAEQQQQEMGMREYRKGNWTVQETMILIEAKKMDDERRKLTKKQAYQNILVTSSPSNIVTSSPSNVIKPVTELRWKWVEEYCWRKGCLRSQNQCNDKWDNLMRDYKKIRDYQRSLTSKTVKGYWEMDKIERKDKSLPTNMLPQIYQALFEVVEQTTITTVAAAATTTTTTTTAAAATQYLQLTPPPPPLPLLQTVSSPTLRLQTQVPFYSQQSHELQPHHLLPTLGGVEAAASEHSQPESSSSKRRRKEERVIAPVLLEGTTTTTTDVPTTTTTTQQMSTATATCSLQEVSLAISRSASIISEVIQANEEKEERRHREIMHLHETRLRFEESKLEVTRQGFNGLTDAINKLANSIHTWSNTSSHKSHQGP